MPENKTRPTRASVEEFLASVDDPVRRSDAERLVAIMSEATGEPPVLWGSSIVGFGTFHYRYESGREGDSPAVGFSPRRTSLVLYVTGGFDGLETDLARLGKHTTGKGCLYIKRLADVDEDALRDVIARSVDHAAGKHVAG